MRTRRWLPIAFILLGASQGGCQQTDFGVSQPPSPKTRDFADLFEEVARQKYSSGVVPVRVMNGETADFRQQTPQEILGMTDEEVRILQTVAADFKTKMDLFDDSVKPLVFAARVELAALEPSAVAVDRLREVKRQRNEVVLTYVQRLKILLGDPMFNKIQAHVFSRKPGESFFPLVPEN